MLAMTPNPITTPVTARPPSLAIDSGEKRDEGSRGRRADATAWLTLAGGLRRTGGAEPVRMVISATGQIALNPHIAGLSRLEGGAFSSFGQVERAPDAAAPEGDLTA